MVEPNVTHTYLVPGEPIRRSSHRKQKSNKHLGGQGPELILIATKATDHTGLVMITQVDRGPTLIYRLIPFRKHLL